MVTQENNTRIYWRFFTKNWAHVVVSFSVSCHFVTKKKKMHKLSSKYTVSNTSYDDCDVEKMNIAVHHCRIGLNANIANPLEVINSNIKYIIYVLRAED